MNFEVFENEVKYCLEYFDIQLFQERLCYRNVKVDVTMTNGSLIEVKGISS